MHVKLKLVTSVIAVVALFSAGIASSAATSTVIVGSKSIGGFHVTSAFGDAQRLFGAPHSETQSTKICIARWTNGLTLAFNRKLPFVKWSKACRSFAWAKAAKTWRTDKGLGVGAAESKIKQLYSHAVRTAVGSQTRWVLNPGAPTQLEAWAKHGRVVFLRLERR